MTQHLYSVAELRRFEQAALRTLPAGTLMQRAGDSTARCVRGMLDARGSAGPVLIVCGPGNNGGDGYATAFALRSNGIEVSCIALGSPQGNDAQQAAQRWADSGGRTANQLPRTVACTVIVDAMFGIGLARPLAGAYLDAANWINATHADVLAIDVPSGLDADRGAWVGGVPGVRADLTATFIGAKPGLHTGHGVDAAGRVQFDALGVDVAASSARLNAPALFEELARPRRRNVHKGSFGDVAIVGGATGMVGAALLAARAALRLGAGRVYVDCLGSGLALDPMQPELMFRAHATLPDDAVRVVGCGMGTADAAASALLAALRTSAPLVIDADGLNLLASDGELQRVLARRTAPSVVTPHPLEAGRLLGISAAEVQSDRIGHARELARRLQAWVVLKGAGSVIAAAQGAYTINPTGSPALASPGTGDVLAGMLGSLLAQARDVEAAVHAAVWLHGAAANRFGFDTGLTAGEIAPRAVRILGELRGGGALTQESADGSTRDRG